MPIVSKSFEIKNIQKDGSVVVREKHVDSVGNEFIIGPYRAASPGEADNLLANRNLTTFLENNEIARAIKFVSQGNLITNFTNVELSTLEFRRRLIIYFMQTDIENKFVQNLASFIVTFSASQISTALSISLANAQRILDRATRIDSVINPAITADKLDKDFVGL